MRIDISDFLRQMSAIERRHAFALEAYGKAAGSKMVAQAKRDRPWTDRTRSAKDGIHFSAEWSQPTRLQVSLRSQMNYGIYLEYVNFKHKGRLSVWWPTVQRMSPEIIKGWANAVSK